MNDEKILERIRESRRKRTTKIGFRTYTTRKLSAADAVIVKSWIATMVGDRYFGEMLRLGAQAFKEGGSDYAAQILSMPDVVAQIAAAFGKVLRDRETADAFFSALFCRTNCDYAIDPANGEVCEGPENLADVWRETLVDEIGELERAAWWVLSQNFPIASYVESLSIGSTSDKAAQGATDTEPSEPDPQT